MTLLRRIAAWLLGGWLLRRGLQIGRKPPPGQSDAQTIEYEVQRRRRAENAVILLLLGTTLGAAGFMVFYVVRPDTQLLGLTLGLAVLLLGIALAVAGKAIVPQEKAEEERHEFGDAEIREESEKLVEQAGEGVSRRGLLVGAGGVAGATLGAAALFPAASLGPSVGATIRSTPWKEGRRVVDADGRPYTPEDVPEGVFRTAFPEGASRSELGSPLLLVRLDPAEIELPEEVKQETIPEGILAFSKICTHAGCAISMYRYPKYDPTEPRPALVCPCHYSTFDVARGGEVVFGPAGRDLPRLPLGLNDARELVARGGFLDRIGPTWGGARQDT